MSGVVVSLNRSNGGVPKQAVDHASVGVGGMEGDRQRDRRFHGGPTRALCLYSLERIEALREEGHPITPGSVGENVTISGIDWAEILPGVRLSIGGVEVEVTSYASPCKTIRASFIGEDFSRISQKLHPGWSRVYVRILREGVIRAGDAVSIER